VQANVLAHTVVMESDLKVRVEESLQAIPNKDRGQYTTFSSARVSGKAGFELEISAKADSDVRIAFMTHHAKQSNDAWEILLGGWQNTRSVIRSGTGEEGKELVGVADKASVGPRTSFRSYLISYSPSTSILSVWNDKGQAPVMHAKVPALPHDELVVALGSWGTTVQYQVVKFVGTKAATQGHASRVEMTSWVEDAFTA